MVYQFFGINKFSLEFKESIRKIFFKYSDRKYIVGIILKIKKKKFIRLILYFIEDRIFFKEEVKKGEIDLMLFVSFFS